MPDVPHLDHGLIGNGSLLALITPSSAVEWLQNSNRKLKERAEREQARAAR